MANCTKCGTHIHSSRQLCNKCAGVTREKGITITTIHTKTRGGMVSGKWESGRSKAARAGVADALDIINGNNSSKPI